MDENFGIRKRTSLVLQGITKYLDTGIYQWLMRELSYQQRDLSEIIQHKQTQMPLRKHKYRGKTFGVCQLVPSASGFWFSFSLACIVIGSRTEMHTSELSNS